MTNEQYGVVASVDELVRMRVPFRSGGLTPSSRVRTAHSGAYDSVFRGRGMEFDESREYQPGDDIRTIDWRVMARTGRVHTKLFQEERERPVLLLVDARPSMRFGTRDSFKSVLAAKAAATLAWAAVDAGDRVGGLLLRPSGHREVAPQRSRGRLVAFLRHLSEATRDEALGTPMALAEGLARLGRVARPGTLIFVLSDFQDLDEAAGRELGRLARRCDVHCILVHDALEVAAPQGGDHRISDGERVQRLPTADASWRRAYADRFARRQARLEGLCARAGAGFLPLRTGDDCQRVLRIDRSARALRTHRPEGVR